MLNAKYKATCASILFSFSCNFYPFGSHGEVAHAPLIISTHGFRRFLHAAHESCTELITGQVMSPEVGVKVEDFRLVLLEEDVAMA